MKIEEFVHIVTHSRKRTGIALLNPERNDFLSDFENAGIEIIDLSAQFSGRVIVADNVLANLVSDRDEKSAICFTNIELYVGPRFEEGLYLRYLVPWLTNKEPIYPIFFVFYSRLLYEKFKGYYLNNPSTNNHFFEEDF